MNVPGGNEFGREEPDVAPGDDLTGECNNEKDAGRLAGVDGIRADKFPLFFQWFPRRHGKYFSGEEGWDKDSGDCYGVVIELPLYSNTKSNNGVPFGEMWRTYIQPFVKPQLKPTMDALVGAEHTYCSWASAMGKEFQSGYMSSPMIERLFQLAMNHKNNPGWMVKMVQPTAKVKKGEPPTPRLGDDGRPVPREPKNQMRQVHVIDARNTMDAKQQGLDGFKGVLQSHWGKLTHYGPVVVVMPAHFLVNDVFGYKQKNYEEADFDEFESKEKRHARAYPCRWGLMRLYDLLRPLHGGLGFPVLLVVLDLVECKHTVDDSGAQVHEKYPCFELNKGRDGSASTCRVLESNGDEGDEPIHEVCEYDDVVWAEIVSEFRAALNATDAVSEIVCEKYRPSTDERKDMWEDMKKLGGRFRAHIFQMTYSKEMCVQFDTWKSYRDGRGDVPEPQLFSRNCEGVDTNESQSDARVQGSELTAYGSAGAPHSSAYFNDVGIYKNDNDEHYGTFRARTIMHPQDNQCAFRMCNKYTDVNFATNTDDPGVDALISTARIREQTYTPRRNYEMQERAKREWAAAEAAMANAAAATPSPPPPPRSQGGDARSMPPGLEPFARAAAAPAGSQGGKGNGAYRSSGRARGGRGRNNSRSNISSGTLCHSVTDDVFAAHEQRAAH